MAEKLTLDLVRKAVSGRAAGFRARCELQPAGGRGTKVFPPTYAGAVYATEKRRLPGRDEPVECVLLDSVQSQANRMEEALQQAVDDGRVTLPVIEADFTPYFGEAKAASPAEQLEEIDLLDPVGKVSSLQAPHRIADAIFRDSLLEGQPFRKSEVGRKIDRASLRNATPLFELCPTALLFGMWDSTGPKGGLGAKFERAMVGEIVGIDAIKGTKTSSRVDPLGIQLKAGPIYEAKDGGWTLDPEQARQLKGKPIVKGKDGRPSEANHGNVTPSLSDRDRDGEYLAGGVTITHAEQTLVISLPALRRLRFPVGGQHDAERDIAARTVLVSLGLLAAALADEAGLDLRSRCLLYPEQDLEWEVLDRNEPVRVALNAEEAIELFKQAVGAAKEAGLSWRDAPLVLTPSEQLVKLVAKSQHLAAEQGGDAEGDA